MTDEQARGDALVAGPVPGDGPDPTAASDESAGAPGGDGRRWRRPVLPLVLLGVAVLGLVIAVAVVASGFNTAQQQKPEVLSPAEVQRIANAGSGVLPPIGFERVAVRAPQFALPLVAGPGRVSVASLRGKPIVVNFWASTCPPCQREMPALASVARALSAKVHFVGVDTKDSSRAAAAAFASKHGAEYPIGYDPAESVGNRYGIVGLPETFFLSPDGTKILAEYVGALNGTSLVHILAQLYHVS
ncbi:MAG TPA: TlpA disulfide reductase family protein [Acidimicrobiales bacterium]|nr:TlpA disulfide reductase family protein [Acidimicrobiales bacterium]